MLVVSPNCTCEEVALKYSPIEGKLGKYMSVTNGPNAVNIPNKSSKKNFEFSFFISFYFEVKTISGFPPIDWHLYVQLRIVQQKKEYQNMSLSFFRGKITKDCPTALPMFCLLFLNIVTKVAKESLFLQPDNSLNPLEHAIPTFCSRYPASHHRPARL